MSDEVDWVGFAPRDVMEAARRAFVLLRAIEIAPDGARPEQVLATAAIFEAWLKGPEKAEKSSRNLRAVTKVDDAKRDDGL